MDTLQDSPFPIPANERQRLYALAEYDILDSPPEAAYDDIARLAAFICGVEKAMISFLDAGRKWHKAKYNITPDEMPRGHVICAHTIMEHQPVVIFNTLEDSRSAGLEVVTQPPHLRFYAGVPLVDEQGFVLGTLCAVDTRPRSISQQQVDALVTLGKQIMQLLQLRKSLKELQQQTLQLQKSYGANSRLHHLATTDELTSLHNRRAFNYAFEHYTHQARQLNTALCLLVIDIDHFKKLNDRRGHSFGDLVLVMVARMLKKRTRKQDFCARYGGEEFVILLPETSLADAVGLAEEYRRTAMLSNYQNERLTISIGIAEYHQQDSASFFDLADQALLKAKQQGRNQVCTEKALLSQEQS